MNVLLTGSTGFVGSVLLRKLIDQQFSTTTALRSKNDDTDSIIVGDITATTDWAEGLDNKDIVIHCAARAHVMQDDSVDPLADYRQVNTAGTLNLARQAAASNVKRFIFISTIKVNGEKTELGSPFIPHVKFAPKDPYGLSKFEAEQGLRKISQKTGMEVVIIRPPLVYGPGVKANFLSMLKFSSKGFPLPFGSMNKNRRSLVSVDNLVDLIVTCIAHPNAANEIFLVSDNEDVSTAELFLRLGNACGKPLLLLPMPIFVFEAAFKLIGKAIFYQRLCGSLQVDISHTMDTLSWQPPYTVDDGFVKTAKYYLENKV